MAFSLGDAVVDIKADTKGLGPSLASAKGMIGGVGTGFMKALGPVAAFVAATLGIKKSIEAFFEAEKATIGLQAALRASGQSVDELMPKYQAWAEQIQKASRVDDDAVIGLLKQATNFGLVGDQAQEATRAAIGLSAAFDGLDKETALKLMAKATEGNTEAMARYIPKLKGVTDQAEAMRIINEAASRGLQQEAELTASNSGAWEQLQNALGNAGETLGELLAGNGQGLIGWLIGMVEQFTEGIKIVIDWKNSMIQSFSEASASGGSFFGVIKSIFAGIVEVMKTAFFGIVNFEMTFDIIREAAVNAFTLIVARAQWLGGNIVKIGGFFFRNWYEIFQDIGNIGITIFSNFIENTKRLFVGIWDFISSGGQKGFEKGFVAPLEGFQSQLKETLTLDAFVPPELQSGAKERFNAAFAEWNKSSEEAGKKTAKDMEAAKAELTKPVNLKLDPNRADKGEKKKEKKDSDAGQFKDLVAAWKDAQTKVIKDEDKVPAQQLKAQQEQLAEQRKANAVLGEIAKKNNQAVLA